MALEVELSDLARGTSWPTCPQTLRRSVLVEAFKFRMFKNGMRPIHPGEILLEDYIKPMGTSVRALSLALQVPYSSLREIIDGNRGVSADTALRLDRYFGSEAQGWLNLQAAYDMLSAKVIHGVAVENGI
jgi:addiction module HigA family antidote